jgi:uncharacterized protein
MKVIKRDLYLEKIRPFMDKPVIKILTGMRRVGKSELLKQIETEILQKNPKKKIISINKELRKFDHITGNQHLNDFIDKSGGGSGTAVLIDEVQEIDGWERSVNSFLAEGMDVYITGSNAHLLASDLATLISGRYVEFKIYTLSFKEFIELGGFENKPYEDLFRKYIKYGGLPGLFHLDFNSAAIYQFLDAIYQTILLKDIVKRYNVRNITQLEDVVNFVFDNIGSQFNASNVVKYLKNQQVKTSVPSVMSLIRHLNDVFIVHKIRQYDLKGKEYLETNAKYYAGDLGLRHAVLGFNDEDISGILENIVYLELCRRDYEVTFGRLGNYEVDFIAEKEEKKLYIQVSYIMSTKETVEREFSVLESVRDNHPKYVISMDKITLKRESGVKHINLFDFLLNDGEI